MQINYTTTVSRIKPLRCNICGGIISTGEMVHEIPVNDQILITCAACVEIARGSY